MQVRPTSATTVVALLLTVVLLHSCASFAPRFEAPTIKISSLTLLEATGLSQRFGIGLLLTNPNSTSLPVAGISYTLSLNGYELVNGVSSDIPNLAAYSETPVTVEASTDLLAALRLLNSLTNERQKKLQYRLAAKIDFDGWRPSVNVERDGVIELTQ